MGGKERDDVREAGQTMATHAAGRVERYRGEWGVGVGGVEADWLVWGVARRGVNRS